MTLHVIPRIDKRVHGVCRYPVSLDALPACNWENPSLYRDSLNPSEPFDNCPVWEAKPDE